MKVCCKYLSSNLLTVSHSERLQVKMMPLNFYSQLTSILTPFTTLGRCIINEMEFKTIGKMRHLRFPWQCY